MSGQSFLSGHAPRQYPTYIFPPPLPPPSFSTASPAVIVSLVRQKKKHKKQPSVYSQSDIEVWKLSDAEIIGDHIIICVLHHTFLTLTDLDG